MSGVRADTLILVDPGVRGVGIDLDGLLADLGGLGVGDTKVVPGLPRHPELLTAAVRRAARTSDVRGAVVVVADFEHPALSDLRMWGEAGGLDPLAVRVVALGILKARRRPEERSAYAVRMVRAAVAALGASDTAKAARRPVGDRLSRRGLLSGRATTWVPVVDVNPEACLGTLCCQRCVQECPEDALQISSDAVSAAPVVDASRCGACSRCLDVCPSGALSLDGHDGRTLSQRLRALLQDRDGATAPALLISCQSVAGRVHDLGERRGLPGWLVLELTCLGGVGSPWFLAALAAGARTVQVLPCARCRDSSSLTEGLHFTQRMLAALGDVDAARRVGMLPSAGPALRHAVRAADPLTPLVEVSEADRIPPVDSTCAPARVVGWALGELQRALARTGQRREGGPLVIQGAGAPLGILRAAEGCTACGVCTRHCPTSALSLSAGPGGAELVVDPAACTGCGVCVQMCPEGVLAVSPGVDLELLDGGCVPIARAPVTSCLGCGQVVPALPAAWHLTSLPAGLANRCPSCRQAALKATV